MKARLAATYPDAFPDGAMAETMDQRPDLESPGLAGLTSKFGILVMIDDMWS
jgi:hypothetical protein